MTPTIIFLIAWLGAISAWEVLALTFGWWEPVSPVLSRLPVWAVLIVMLVWAVLVVHWWVYTDSTAYRNFLERAFR